MVKGGSIVYMGQPTVTIPEILYEENDKTSVLITSQRQGNNILVTVTVIYSMSNPILNKRTEVATSKTQWRLETDGLLTTAELYGVCPPSVSNLRESLRFPAQWRAIPRNRIVCPLQSELERNLQDCVEEFLKG